MENNNDKIVNMMGSEVVDGFMCKPKKFDANKPIMHFKTQIFICDDERCGKAHKGDDKAKELREIIKDLKLAKGADRIKVVRTGCFGACRFRSVANIFENTRINGSANNNGIWLKNTHKYSREQWIELFTALAENKNIDDLGFEQVPMSHPETYTYE